MIAVCIASAWLSDWYVLERAGRGPLECGRICAGVDIEGTAADMRIVASAIESATDTQTFRMSVRHTTDGVWIGAPRNGERRVLLSHDAAKMLAISIRAVVPSSSEELLGAMALSLAGES